MLIAFTELSAQIIVRGRVFDITKKTPLEAVTVRTTSGRGAISDSLGYYVITARNESDSVYFSFLDKNTNKFAVSTIPLIDNFEVSIHVNVRELPSVLVRTRNYREDSIQNRQDYAKVFNFKKPTLRTVTNSSSAVGAAFDLESIINMFRFRHNRNMAKFRERLLQQERDAYVNHRFSKRFVGKVTQLKQPELDTFMLQFRPSYDLVTRCNDLELGYYIQEAFKMYLSIKNGTSWQPPKTPLILAPKKEEEED